MKCTMQHLLWISFLVFSSSILLANSVNTDCDIMILLDSSQSITMDWFIEEIEFAKTMVNSTTSSLPETANIGAINYSGCPSGTFEDCISDGRLLTLWGLQTYADDLPSVYNSFDALDNNDFTKGKSWTDDALRLALLQFQNYSSNPSEKNIVLLTDRQPTLGHEPCKTSTNYTSTTLQQLNEMNVTIYLVAVVTAQTDNDEYWNCVVQNASDQLFHVTHISELSSFGTIVSDRLCAFTWNPTIDPTIEPTFNPTKEPTNEPTNNPTTEPTTEFTLYVSESTTESEDEDENDKNEYNENGMEIGIIVGCVFGICLTGLFLGYYCWKRKSTDDEAVKHEVEMNKSLQYIEHSK